MSFTIEEERHPRLLRKDTPRTDLTQVEQQELVAESSQTQIYSLEDASGQPVENGFNDADSLFAHIGSVQKAQRSKTERGSRSVLFSSMEEETRPALETSSVNAEGVKFDRRRDRYDFKVDQNQPKPERQYVDGIPLLLDLNEILNLDVHRMAVKFQNEKKRQQRRQKVAPELAAAADDPEIQLIESIQIQLPEEAKEENIHYINLKSQVVRDLWREYSEDEKRGSDGSSEESEEDEGDQTAQRTLMQMMMSGEHPDAQIDKLLESYGVQLSQIGLITTNSFIKETMSEELREKIEEICLVLKNWSSNQITERTRRLFLADLVDNAHFLGISLSVEHLLPGLNKIIQDRSAEQEQYQRYILKLFGQLSQLISFLSQSEISAGYDGVRDYIMPLYNEFFLNGLVDDDVRVQLQPLAVEQMAMINRIFMHEDRADKILPIVLELLKDDEEKRIAGLELLDALAEDFGSEICQNYLIYEIASLQDDPRYKVRKETVKRIINISKVVQPEVFQGVLLPVFKKLCTDHIWGVRRQAVEVLPEMCKLAPDEVKNGPLLEIFKRFTQDSSKWVKQAATQFLGPFIVCYDGLNPSPELLDFYIQMVTESLKPAKGMSNNQGQDEVLFHCAYNFPAVLLTLGPSAWPKLKPLHEKLVRDSRLKVRKTLAYSLFELTKILGASMTESELVPVLFYFMKDSDEVKEGVMVSLPDFVANLDLIQRESYVDKLAEAWVSGEENWRKRAMQVEQMGRLASLFSPQVFAEKYLKQYFEMCQDQVAQVRETAARACYFVARSLAKHQSLLDSFMDRIRAFKQSRKYTMRQTFIVMCESVFRGDPGDVSEAGCEESEQIFIEQFLPSFVELQSDRIVNVRIHASQTLALLFDMQKKRNRRVLGSRLCSDKKILEMIQRLRVDSNKDVSRFLAHVELPEEVDSPIRDPVLEQEQIEELIEESKTTLSTQEQKELVRTQALLGYVQRGKESQLVKLSKSLRQEQDLKLRKEEVKESEDKAESEGVEETTSNFLSQIYDAAIRLQPLKERENAATVLSYGQGGGDVQQEVMAEVRSLLDDVIYAEAIQRRADVDLMLTLCSC